MARWAKKEGLPLLEMWEEVVMCTELGKHGVWASDSSRAREGGRGPSHLGPISVLKTGCFTPNVGRNLGGPLSWGVT